MTKLQCNFWVFTHNDASVNRIVLNIVSMFCSCFAKWMSLFFKAYSFNTSSHDRIPWVKTNHFLKVWFKLFVYNYFVYYVVRSNSNPQVVGGISKIIFFPMKSYRIMHLKSRRHLSFLIGATWGFEETESLRFYCKLTEDWLIVVVVYNQLTASFC